MPWAFGFGVMFVVVNGKEGNPYGGIIPAGGESILFDSAGRFHYLALQGEAIYLVEERVH